MNTTAKQSEDNMIDQYPDKKGHFGVYGGSFIAETLMDPVRELQEAYERYRLDNEFIAEFPDCRRDFFIWAVCSAYLEIRYRRRIALSFLALAFRSMSPVRLQELRLNLKRMQATKVRWSQRERQRAEGT